MMKLKKITLAAVLFVGVSSHLYAAGIPVIDVTNLAQAVQTVAQLRQQLTQLQQMEAAVTGSRGMGALLNQPGLRQNLPQNAQNIYSGATTGLAGIDNAITSIQNAESVGNNLANEIDQLSERKRSTAYRNKAMTQQAYSNAIQRLNNIEALARQIDFATDQKAAMDLSNRINQENSLIQSEQQRVTLLASLQQNEQAVIQQKTSDLNSKILDPTKSGMPQF